MTPVYSSRPSEVGKKDCYKSEISLGQGENLSYEGNTDIKPNKPAAAE